MTCARCNDLRWVPDDNPDEPGIPCPWCNAKEQPDPPADFESFGTPEQWLRGVARAWRRDLEAEPDDYTMADGLPTADATTDSIPNVFADWPPQAPAPPPDEESLWEVQRPDGATVSCVLKRRGDYGVEARIFVAGDFLMSRLCPTRESAAAWADGERRATLGLP